MVLKIGRKMYVSMFLNEKLVDLYLSITSGPLNYVCKKCGVNYSHGIQMLNIWEDWGLLIKNKAGYRYNIFYTAKGKSLSESLVKLKVQLKRSKIQWQGDDNDSV